MYLAVIGLHVHFRTEEFRVWYAFEAPLGPVRAPTPSQRNSMIQQSTPYVDMAYSKHSSYLHQAHGLLQVEILQHLLFV